MDFRGKNSVKMDDFGQIWVILDRFGCWWLRIDKFGEFVRIWDNIENTRDRDWDQTGRDERLWLWFLWAGGGGELTMWKYRWF
jgi:hypothetical protein